MNSAVQTNQDLPSTNFANAFAAIIAQSHADLSAGEQDSSVTSLSEAASDLAAKLGQQYPDHFMSYLNKMSSKNESGNPQEDAAHTLSNLSQANAFAPPPTVGPGVAGGPNNPGGPFPMDPGPSSHPRGPPNLGHLAHQQQQSNLAHLAVAAQQQGGMTMNGGLPLNAGRPGGPQDMDIGDGMGDQDGDMNDDGSGMGAGVVPQQNNTSGSGTGGTGRGRASRSATMGSDEWSRQRKDNHKEVERRRRGNINEGINELGRIVPNSTGEKAKGAILSRAVQYIHHLKENEARNIEKWTLEKLLMDQAMGDQQAQLEEMKKVLADERRERGRVEAEMEGMRNKIAALQAQVNNGAAAGQKRAGDGEDARGGKRLRAQE